MGGEWSAPVTSQNVDGPTAESIHREPSADRTPRLGGTYSVEGISTRARARGVRVVDREALLLDRVFEVNGSALEVGNAHLVDDHLDPVEVTSHVAVEQTLVEVEAGR